MTSLCAGCSRAVPAISGCCEPVGGCPSYCRDCTRGMRARQVPGYPVDILTCGACGTRIAVHRGQRRPCRDCPIAYIPEPKWYARAEAAERAADRAAGFEFVAHARHNLLSSGARAKEVSGLWYRHLVCGRIVPRIEFRRYDAKTGELAPPYCPQCRGERWRPANSIPPAARDLLYLVRFDTPGRRFLKVGRTLVGADRLPSHLRLGARVVQVVESRHDKVLRAEKNIIAACAGHRMTTHPFTHFGTDETFRMGARPLIDDLAAWIGRGAHDRTADWVS